MIQPKVNDEFEPSKMECLETTNNPALGNNIITHVINVGYMLHDVVLKPALVKVRPASLHKSTTPDAFTHSNEIKYPP